MRVLKSLQMVAIRKYDMIMSATFTHTPHDQKNKF